MGALLTFIRWLGQKAATAGLILVLALSAGGLWLFLRDNVDFDEWRSDVLRTLTGERAKIQTALGDVHNRLERTTRTCVDPVRLKAFEDEAPAVLNLWNQTHDWSQREKVFGAKEGYVR